MPTDQIAIDPTAVDGIRVLAAGLRKVAY